MVSSKQPNGRTSRLGRENATATLGQTPRPQWLPYQGREVSRGESSRLQTSRPFTKNQQPPTRLRAS
ncbi:MAG: hypothetical protein ACHBN1_22440 [Heteroscytonema crispum UTEX LB 1556]